MSRLLRIAALTLCLSALLAAPAMAAFDLQELDVTFEEQVGTQPLQAGSHPFQMSTSLGISTISTPDGDVPEGELRNLDISQIAGFVGSQTAVPTCDQADFNKRFETRPACSDDSAVGYAAVEAEFEVIPPAKAGAFFHVPVYNLDPPPGVAAQLGFVVLNVPITVDVRVSDESPFNLIAELKNVSQAVLLYRTKVVLWGNPASPAHDSLRGNCLGEVSNTSLEPVSEGDCPLPPGTPENAFLTLPRSCAGPLETVFEAVDWAGVRAIGSATTHNAVEDKGIEECETLDFGADVSAQVTSTSASSATGLDFGMSVDDPGLTDPDLRAKSDIRRVVATLPPGMTLNPSAGNGLEACSQAQYEAEGPIWTPAVGCPQASKVGTAEVQSPLLDETLKGNLFVAEQNKNPFNSTFAVYLVIRSERYGVLIRQAGKVEPNPLTGQLTTTFDEIPQLPFADLTVKFRGGPRAPLTTPETCGTHSISATLTPWNGAPDETEITSFGITSGPGGSACPAAGPRPFAPTFNAGTLTNVAGSYSPFYMQLAKGDGQQDITRFDAILPPGVVGKIAGLGRCSEAALAAAKAKSGREELASPSCPASSQVGHILAGAGVGSSLTYVPGTIYLAGPFGGAPLSVAVVTPAVAGPFDLGTVVTREALNLDPTTAEVRVDGAASDPIPHILKGVPLHLRDLRVYIDRPDFTLNATSCEPLQAKASVFGSALDVLSPADDAAVNLTDRYQASKCGKLKFKPKLRLKLTGATKRSGNPALSATLTARPGDANIGRAVVTLPPSENIDNAHINNPCTRVQFSENACPKSSILGYARAFSPLLDKPLEGPVYFRSNGGERLLPDIVADLNGEFRIILVGFIDSKKKRIRTTFATVPDAPVSKFRLKLFGGKRGLLENNRNLCKGELRSKFRFTGQNGKVSETRPVLNTSCKKSGKKKRSR